jgi:hypothetical protein
LPVALAILALAVLSLSCARVLPWSKEPIGSEVNLAFTLDHNLVRLNTVRIDGHTGHFLLGTAAPRTIVDAKFPLRTFYAHAIQYGERETVRIDPAITDLGGVADAIIGAEAWSRHAITIDYRVGLVSYQKEGIKSGGMYVYNFPNEPMINVIVDGKETPAIVDTTSPDTIVLPGGGARGTANVRVADVDFGTIDIAYQNVHQARVGNRVLSRFLVTIDYGRKVVGLWRDPRTAP